MGPINVDVEGNPDLEETLRLEGGIPQNFYITGYLEPRRWNDQEECVDGFTDEASLASDGSEGAVLPTGSELNMDQKTNEITTGKTMQAPSSMGVSVVIGDSVSEIKIDSSWGRYCDAKPHLWERTHFSRDLHIPEEELNRIFSEPTPVEFNLEETGVFIHLRGQVMDGRRHLTVRMVNRIEPEGDTLSAVGRATIFQCELRVNAAEFVDARWESDLETDLTTGILYHDSTILARGHNISCDWNGEGTSVWTAWIPCFEVRKMQEKQDLQQLIPPMEDLYDSTRFTEGLNALQQLVDAYRSWSDSLQGWYQTEAAAILDERGYRHFESHLESIDENIRRMDSGLDLLRSSGDAAEAFRRANEAIFLSASSPAGKLPNFRWRPFQISFILVNLSGLLWFEEGGESDRNIIDLAWFPTGGGKTEAYLGLIATLGFYRHLKGVDPHPSVQTIMRYTLRLLTLNQGERATRLMVGMNIVAEKHGLLGNPFNVGMWIGSAATPNDLASAKRILNEMKETGGPPEKGPTPLQLEDCPWCGESIGNPDYWNVQNGRLIGHCANSDCELSVRPVPFSCVDEELYAHPPTLLIATVDKFARLASKPESRVLIGLRQGDRARRQPDLVIQDELHLLTGPLGSLAGLFETAIETLWNRIGHRPKYVAATATIRGAKDDAHLMYGRRLNVFPPPGKTIRDNFFAVERDDLPGRIHAGVIGNLGHSTTLLERPVASMLQRISTLSQQGVSDENLDPYWTPIGYFNSIRELSGAQSSIEDAISQQHIPEFALRQGSEPREINEFSELFSRKKAHDLKVTLTRLRNSKGQEDCLDICLTTNMFQVGIDVDRLGLMLINGQPKSNSEYIQASGRVGRDTKRPGLVVSLLRSTKPRDLSHYEMHRSFHQEMYRHVDITTTTPFSPRAFDRAMPSILMLLIRQGLETTKENDGIRELVYPAIKREGVAILDLFLEGVLTRVTQTEHRDIIEQKVRSLWQQLKNFASRHQQDGLWRTQDPFGKAWAKQFNGGPSHAEDILDSLRDVSEDVPYGSRINGVPVVFGKLPENHLFSHALPGGLWDKDGKAVMTKGLNDWEMTQNQRERLEMKEPVLKTLLPNSKIFEPPKNKDQGIIGVTNMPYEARCSADPAHISVPKETRDGLFCGHPDCDKPAVPVRFISLCGAGHLAPFDWNSWVQHKEGCNSARDYSYRSLRMKKKPGAGYTLSAWVLSCTSCGAYRSLKGITISDPNRGKQCNGLRPWISWEPEGNCDHKLSNRRRNSSSVAHPDGGKVLLIHPNVNWYLASKLEMFINPPDDQFDHLFDMGYEPFIVNQGLLDGTIYDRRIGDPNADPAFDKEKFKNDLVNYRNRPDTARRENIRKLERTGLAHGRRQPVDDGKHYLCYTKFGGEVPAAGWWMEEENPVSHVSRVERLTEIQYITGIRRLDMSESQPLGSFTGEEGNWNLGKYNYGEGIYIGIRPEWLENQIATHNHTLDVSVIKNRSIAHEMNLELQPTRHGLPILHTFSHLIIKELCQASGYSLGSITERLYLETDEQHVQKAGILLYTTGSSSDGTLGGLSSQAEQPIIEKIVKRALQRKNECSNDPICSEHQPTAEEPNGAACHACVLLPESCCELGNHLLDRNWG